MHISNNHFLYQQILENMKDNNFKSRTISYILPPVCPWSYTVEDGKSFIIDFVEHMMK